MSGTSTYKQVTITERSNASHGERIRAVGMCFYGRGQDLTTGNLYRLKWNPSNPKDDSCIVLTENGVVKQQWMHACPSLWHHLLMMPLYGSLNGMIKFCHMEICNDSLSLGLENLNFTVIPCWRIFFLKCSNLCFRHQPCFGRRNQESRSY